MALEVGAELEAALFRHGLAEHHAVGIADRNEHRRHRAGGCVEVHLVGFALERRRQVGGSERRPADVQLGDDLRALGGKDAHRVRPVDGAQLEALAGAVLEDRVRGCDAQSVPALLRLGAVGVEDAHAHRGRVEGEQAVRAEAEVAIAQPWQQPHHFVERPWQVHDQVVVAEGLVLDQT